MSTSFYGFIALTGGTTGCLDYIDGALLSDKDQAVGSVLSTGIFRVYALNASSGATADGVNIIAPTANAGTKRWILQRPSLVPAGSVVQVVNYQRSDKVSGSGTIPVDDTIPQKTEGDQILTVSITPKLATNKLRIDVSVQFQSASNTNSIALFQDSTSNALDARTTISYVPSEMTMTYYMAAGTTSSTTFNVRFGTSGGQTYYINSYTTNTRAFGGVCYSSITITEVQV